MIFVTSCNGKFVLEIWFWNCMCVIKTGFQKIKNSAHGGKQQRSNHTRLYAFDIINKYLTERLDICESLNSHSILIKTEVQIQFGGCSYAHPYTYTNQVFLPHLYISYKLWAILSDPGQQKVPHRFQYSHSCVFQGCPDGCEEPPTCQKRCLAVLQEWRRVWLSIWPVYITGTIA